MSHTDFDHFSFTVTRTSFHIQSLTQKQWTPEARVSAVVPGSDPSRLLLPLSWICRRLGQIDSESPSRALLWLSPLVKNKMKVWRPGPWFTLGTSKLRRAACGQTQVCSASSIQGGLHLAAISQSPPVARSQPQPQPQPQLQLQTQHLTPNPLPSAPAPAPHNMPHTPCPTPQPQPQCPSPNPTVSSPQLSAPAPCSQTLNSSPPGPGPQPPFLPPRALALFPYPPASRCSPHTACSVHRAPPTQSP